MIQKVVRNYRADIVASKVCSSHYRSQKDKFYVKDECLSKMWSEYKKGDWTIKDLYESASEMVSPAVENMEFIVVDMKTGNNI